MQTLVDTDHLALEIGELQVDEPAMIDTPGRPRPEPAVHPGRAFLQHPGHDVRHVGRAPGEGATAAEFGLQEPATGLVTQLHRLHQPHRAQRAGGDHLPGPLAAEIEASIEADGIEQAARACRLGQPTPIGEVHHEGFVH